MEEEPLHIQSGDPTPEWMNLNPTVPAGVSPLIAALVEELSCDYPLPGPAAEPVAMPAAYPSLPSSPLLPIGDQLGTLFSVRPQLSPN